MKLFVILLILLIPLSSAISITEVELNPAGSDTGGEWVEFYSEIEIDLEGYKLVNNDGDEIELNESFSGYYVYEFEKQWLDNSDEKVLLYDGEELIDETDVIFDSKNDERSLSYCGEWRFVSSTKGEENDCKEDEFEEEVNDYGGNEPGMNDGGQDEINNETEIVIDNLDKPVVEEIIYLGDYNGGEQKNIKGQVYVSKSVKIVKYSCYGFVVLSLLIFAVYIIKRLKHGE